MHFNKNITKLLSKTSSSKGYEAMKNQNKSLNANTILERRSSILELIESTGQVKVNELCKHFKVSEVTIRNDLSQLEQKGLLIRARGGAIRAQGVSIDIALNVKAKKQLEEKRTIGKKAAELIQEGDTIILDSGTTTMEIAINLTRFNELTVITNALNIAQQLAKNPGFKIIVPGGILRPKALSMVGPTSETAIQDYYCDKLFLGVDGIDSQYGISTPNEEEAHLNRKMMEISKEVFVATDSSKFNQRSLALIAPMNQINSVITDKNLPKNEQEKLTNMGIKLFIV